MLFRGLTHSPLYIGLMMLLVLGLAIAVSLKRMKADIYLGDGGDRKLLQAIRAHGSTFEHVLGISLLLVVLELSGAPKTWVAWLGGLALLSRVVQSVGWWKMRLVYLAGTVLTYLVEGALVLAVIWRGYSAMRP